MKHNLIKFAAVGALAAGMAFAQAPAAAPAAPAHRETARRHAMQQLNRTEAQKEQAKSIFQQTRQHTQMVREQLRTNRAALAAAVKADNQEQIQKLAVTQGQLRGQMLAARSEAMAKFYKILTPAQRAKAEQIRQAVRQRMQQRFHRGAANG